MKQITITDSCYTQWVKDLAKRYRQSQIKAAVKVNSEMLEFYWHLGREIVETKAESRWGAHFFKNLSEDLRRELPDVDGFSQTNLLYMKNFYLLYSKTITPQLGEQNQSSTIITPQLGEHFPVNIFLIPWGHHKLLIDKFKNQQDKALFYVKKTIEFGWSRSMLLNFLDSDLYEREGKALTNFSNNRVTSMQVKRQYTCSIRFGRQ